MKWSNEDYFCNDLPTSPKPELGKILVTGGTGYIGGRLVPELINRGYTLRVMVRGDADLYHERWPEAEVVSADALNYGQLLTALEGIDVAFYLIHSLALGPKHFDSADVKAASNFSRAAKARKLKRIIYLGGLGEINEELSMHLKSRLTVADVLKKGTVPTTFLRAAIIIGSGSASYEIIEHLVRNCPVIFVPRWAKTRCQPIAIRDVIKYLVGCLETPETENKVFDIGGQDILTYEIMLKTLSDIYKIKRRFIHVPISNVKLYSYFASLLTPVQAPIVYCLMESIHCDVVCQNSAIKSYVPFEPITYKEALVRALSRIERDKVATRWTDSYPPAHELAIVLRELAEPVKHLGSYSILSDQNSKALFQSVCMIGGKKGWFNSNLLWRIRGWLDTILLGVGAHRGRRSSYDLRINDVIDFWRVEDMKKDKRLLLRAEMRLPGLAWMEYLIEPIGKKNRLTVNAYFHTKSPWGDLYWYIFLPFHAFIFSDLVKQIEKRSWDIDRNLP